MKTDIITNMKNACIFCAIVCGEIPSYKVYENNLFFGFLDIHPRVPGHTLLIPKKHYQWVYDVPEFGAYWQAVLHVTQAMKKALSPRFITYMTHGLEIPHAHIHILPRTHETEIAPKPLSLDEKKMKHITQLLQSFNKL